MERITATAQALVAKLRVHPAVENVRYPGFSGLLSFDVADAATARKVETSLRVIKNATSLGGTESVLESRRRWEGERVPAGLLRLSVGLEDPDELWADLEQALAPA
jgi:cystathionine gamma-synthase